MEATAKLLITALRDSGSPLSANVVESLLQQRAELLEALKLLLEDADSTCESCDIAKEAITKAEAAE